MMELMRNWILSITCGAMLNAILQMLMPEGGAKKVGGLVGGLLLLVATVQPLMVSDTEVLFSSLTEEWTPSVNGVEHGLSGENELLKSVIEDRTEAYILDKAKELGITCTVHVTCRYEEKSGLFYPDEVTVYGLMKTEDQNRLTHIIEREVAIDVRRQTYTSEVG